MNRADLEKSPEWIEAHKSPNPGLAVAALLQKLKGVSATDTFSLGRGGHFFFTQIKGTNKRLLASLRGTQEWIEAHMDPNPNEAVAYLLRGIGGQMVDEFEGKNRFVDQGLAVWNSRTSNIALVSPPWVTAAVPAVPGLIQLGKSNTGWVRTQTGCVDAITSGGLDQAAGTVSTQSQDVANDTYQVAKTFTASADHLTPNGVKEASIRVSDGGAGFYGTCRATVSERQVTSGNDLISTYKLKLVP